MIVVGDIAEEPGGVLMDHLQPAAIDRRQRSGIGRMEVKHHLRCRMQQVDTRVDGETRGRRPSCALQGLPVFVDHEQAARSDPMEANALGVDQEPTAREHDREVIADAFMHAKARDPAKCSRHIDARLLCCRLIARHVHRHLPTPMEDIAHRLRAQ
jgi:hypothetical protein